MTNATETKIYGIENFEETLRLREIINTLESRLAEVKKMSAKEAVAKFGHLFPGVIGQTKASIIRNTQHSLDFHRNELAGYEITLDKEDLEERQDMTGVNPIDILFGRV